MSDDREPEPSAGEGRAPSGAAAASGGPAAVGAAALAVGGGLAFTQPSITGGDLWWHLAAGREIARQGAIPARDPFSHTADRDWLNHEWLWDLGAFGLFDLHPDLLAWVQVALLAATLACVYRGARLLGGSRVAAVLACWAAAAASHWFIEIRPHLVTLLGVACVVETRERPWAPWLWPAAIALWVNLHGGFLFGAGLIGLAALLPDLRASLAARRVVLSRGRWLGVAGALLAIGLNPWGYAIVAYPLTYLDDASYVRDLIEWQAPALSLDPRDYGGRFLWLAALAGVGGWAARREEDGMYRAAAAGVAFAMAVVSLRFIPLFAVLAAPLVARGLVAGADLAGRDPRAHRVLQLRWLRPLAGALLVLAALWLWRDVRLWPRLLDRWTEASMFPDVGVHQARALGIPGLRLMNENGWGGYISYHAPELRIFYDGRANTVYGEQVAADYAALREARPGHRRILTRRGVSAALLLPDAPLAAALARDAPVWRVAYSSPREILLVAPGLANAAAALPAPSELAAELPSAGLAEIVPALGAGDVRRALQLSERLLARDPLHLPAHRIAMNLHARRLDRAALEAAAARALAALPRAHVRLRQAQASAYTQLGRPELALALLRSVHDGGPTQLDAIIALQIRQLEAATGGAGR